MENNINIYRIISVCINANGHINPPKQEPTSNICFRFISVLLIRFDFHANINRRNYKNNNKNRPAPFNKTSTHTQLLRKLLQFRSFTFQFEMERECPTNGFYTDGGLACPCNELKSVRRVTETLKFPQLSRTIE